MSLSSTCARYACNNMHLKAMIGEDEIDIRRGNQRRIKIEFNSLRKADIIRLVLLTMRLFTVSLK